MYSFVPDFAAAMPFTVRQIQCLVPIIAHLTISRHRVVDDPGAASRSLSNVLVGEVGVMRGVGGVGMTEQAAHSVEVETAHRGMAPERVPAVVDPHIVKTHNVSQLALAHPDVLHRAVTALVGEDEPPFARKAVQRCAGRRQKPDRLRLGLGVGQHDACASNPVPAQPVISEDREPVNIKRRIAAEACWSSASTSPNSIESQR